MPSKRMPRVRCPIRAEDFELESSLPSTGENPAPKVPPVLEFEDGPPTDRDPVFEAPLSD